MTGFYRLLMAVAALIAAWMPARSMEVTGATVSWPLDKGTDNVSKGVSSHGDCFSVMEFATGSNLAMTGVRTDGGISATTFQPNEGNNGENNDANAVIFTVRPKRGLTVAPRMLELKASRVGTNGGSLAIGVTVDGRETIVEGGMTPALVKEAPYQSALSYDLSTLGKTSGPVVVKVYLRGLANNKQYALEDVTLTTDIAGEVEAVAQYTLGVTVADAAAGEVTSSPAAGLLDEGTPVTVSATENFGYHFEEWTDETGKRVSTDNPYSFELKGNTLLTARYSSKPVYALNVTTEGGANGYQVELSPAGNVVDGVHYYEEGTDVRLTANSNAIMVFLNWEDNSTLNTRTVKMDSEKNVTAVYSAADYIVGWDFYNDQPASERAADFKAESDNAGLLSLRNAAGNTTSWLSRGAEKGAENGKWAARIWKKLSEKNYFEVSFSTAGYTDVKVQAALGVNYNTYSKVTAEYSVDGKEFKAAGTYELKSGWTEGEVSLPAEAWGRERVWVRYMPDYGSALVGNAGDYDGLAIAELFVTAEREAVNDTEAPRLVNTIPAAGSDDATSSGSIVLTFDEKIAAGAAGATLNGKAIEGRVSGKSMVWSYAGLDYGTDYTFVLERGAVTDRYGNAFEGVTLRFRTMERSQPEARTFDAIVAADGSGDYATVQEAIDAAPEGRVTPWLIFVKNGRYKGHVDIPASKPMLHIIGQDRDETVILDDKLCGGPNALHVSVGATVVVKSNDCFFENITLENSYGHEKCDGPQALALNTMGDRTVFNNVAMLSYQDTWITPSTSNYRAFVKNSLIEGAVDFIYNSGNIFIESTTLLITRKSGGYIVAPSHGADVEWGYVFNNCVITAPGVPSETSVWLGRPWHNYPKTVFLNTRAEVTIPATGWYETMGGLPAIWADWNTTDGKGNLLDLSQRRDTYYYTDASGNKVYGKAKNRLTDEEAAQYTVANVLTGKDAWTPVIKTEACAAPTVKAEGSSLTWEAVPYAICYVVTCDGKVMDITTETSHAVTSGKPESYAVQAVNEWGGLSAKGRAGASGVNGVEATGATVVSSEWFGIDGRRLGGVQPSGVTVVRETLSDGSVRVVKVAR